MQEFNALVDKALQNGYAPDHRTGINSPFFETMVGLKASPFQAVALPAPSTPFTLPVAASSPFPHAFFGESASLLVYGDSVYSINRSTWAVTEETLYDPNDVDTAVTLDVGTGEDAIWHFADFGNVWILANAGNLVFRCGHLKRFGNDPVWRTYAGQDARVTTVCRLGDILILGGLQSSTYFDSSTWADFWTAWFKTHGTDPSVNESTVIGKNFLMYSLQGGGGFDWPFALELALLGYVDDDTLEIWKSRILQLIHSGVIGFIQVPEYESVKMVKPLGDRCVVYSVNGIGVVSFAPGARPEYRKVMDIGVYGRGTVAGDDKIHVFADSSGALWRITPNSGPEFIGYRQLFSDLADDAIMSYDPVEGDFFITDATHCYVLSRSGLSESLSRVWSVTNLPSGLVGIVDAEDDDGTFDLVTGPVDMGRSWLKKIQNIEVGADDVTELKVSVLFQYTGETGWRETEAVSLDASRVGYVPVSADRFKVRVTGTAGANAQLRYISIRWQESNRQHVRGLRNAGL